MAEKYFNRCRSWKIEAGKWKLEIGIRNRIDADTLQFPFSSF
jgi:hypothetical protein